MFIAWTGVTGLLAGGTLVAASPQARAAETVPPERAGVVEVIGIDMWSGNTPIRESYPFTGGPTGPWIGVNAGSDSEVIYGVRADAGLDLLTPNAAPVWQVPPALSGEKVVSVSAGSTTKGALTDEGVPHLWGLYAADYVFPADQATLGGKPVQIAGLGLSTALLLDTGKVGLARNDGTYQILAALGEDVEEIVPAGIGLAVRLGDGGSRFWNANTGEVTSPPAPIAAALVNDPLVDVDAGDNGQVGVTASGAVYVWGYAGDAMPGWTAFPADQSGARGRVVEVASGSNQSGYLARTNTGDLVSWGSNDSIAPDPASQAIMTDLAEELSGPGVVRIANGYQTFRVIVGPEVAEFVDTPSIAGTPEVGSTLTGTPATFSLDGVTVANQWLADGAEIAGATATTFEPTSAQVGKSITFRSSTVHEGDTLEATSAAVGPVTEPVAALEVDAPPTIAGTPKVGSTLTGTPATFNATDGVTLSNQWLADGSEIASATGTTLVLTSAQLGKQITFRTTAVRGGETVPSTSAAVGPVTEPLPDLAVGDPPTIAGTPQVGSTLTGTPATFNATDGVVLSNQWLADGAEIDGATGTTFVLTSAHLGKSITFRTTAVRGGETVPSTSAAVGPVTEQVVVNPPVPGDTPECQAAKSGAVAAQAALGAAQAKATKAKTKLKKAKKAKKPAKVKKLKAKLKKAKQAQKAAAAAAATANANVTTKCS
ncbi:hypothetical protein [Nocardioides sp. BYT-33-1]|uniref:hypothetical protein n=1 Tax=Nocardioides sp. BYT-33-1 TaxID=3416952 RepID=UPI003F533809